MIEKPKRPDCNSCYHFSKCDFNETEGYCRICKKHLNPKEGEDCEQFEPFSLYCDTDSVKTKSKICPYYMKYCDCEDEEYAMCDLSSVYPRQTEEMFDTSFGSMKANSGKSDDPTTNALFDTRAIKPEKYAELREQDFDTWLDTILHEIIEQVNFDASEVDALGDAVWNGECPDGTPYPKLCAREDAYIQCIRQSNQLDGFMKNVDITVNSLDERLNTTENKTRTIIADLEEHEQRLLSSEAKIELLCDKVDALKDLFDDLEAQINDLSIRFDEFKKFIFYPCVPATSKHTCSNFCGNCTHYQAPTSSVTLPTCKLSGEIVDPDDSSCAMFEHPF